ncbi:MAG: hypothetical protein QW292_14140 [Candidatus Parvarchaeota archaeon]
MNLKVPLNIFEKRYRIIKRRVEILSRERLRHFQVRVGGLSREGITGRGIYQEKDIISREG